MVQRCRAGGSKNLYSHYGISMVVLREFGIDILQDSAISLLCIYQRALHPTTEALAQFVFIAVLFLVAGNWKQSKCPQTDE